MASWAIATPPGAGPDEFAHYIRALGVGKGELRGHAPHLTAHEQRLVDRAEGAPPAAGEEELTTDETAHAWLLRLTREMSVPRGLIPGFACVFLDEDGTDQPAHCQDLGRLGPLLAVVGSEAATPTGTSPEVSERTYVGTYQPLTYALPGVAMRAVADDAYTAIRVGRLTYAAMALALLALAVLALWDPRQPLSLIGPLVAITPAALFLCSMISPSGPEAAAAVCFTAGLLRLVRNPPAPDWVWLVAAAGGVVLALSRQLGPLFIAFALLAVLLLRGPGSAVAAWKGARRAGVVAAVLVGLGLATGLFWELSYQPHPEWSLSAGELGDAVAHLPEVMRQQIGFFGSYLEAPVSVFVPWALLVLTLIAAALGVGDRRQRLGLVLVIVASLALATVLSVQYERTGFEGRFEGRHVFALFVIVPLYAGEVLMSHAERLSPSFSRRLVLGFTAAAGTLQLIAWWFSARRFAVGTDGPLLFTSGTHFQPPGGWVPWLLLACLAAICYPLAGVAATRRLRDEDRDAPRQQARA
jgi:hypothetical protein